MKATIKVEKEFDIKYLKIDAHIRYFEDSNINGVPDEDTDDVETGRVKPRMPFMQFCEVGFNKKEWRWKPIIDVDEGRILNWPEKTTANIQYKVCYEGQYTLLDKHFERVYCVDSYVPSCIGEYGDYIVMNIDENGYIEDFSFDQDDVDNIIENAF